MNLLFPYNNFRKYQGKMVNEILNALQEEKHMIVHAPTGIGKTVAAIAPCLTYSLENGKTVFFLTPKHTQHQIVIETLKKISKKFNKNIISVDFIGKQWMCPIPGTDSLTNFDFNEFCKEMKEQERCEYYNNVRKNVKLTEKAKDLINNLKLRTPLHVEEVIDFCIKNETCPYEISCELAKNSNFILGDYYHVFHPSIRIAFFRKINKYLEDAVFIIDEAQNLPERIRDLLSSKISNFSLRRAIKEAREFGEIELANDIVKLKEIFEELTIDLENEKFVNREEFISLVNKIRDFDEFVGDLITVGEFVRREKRRSSIGHLGNFLNDWLNEGDAFVRFFRKEGEKVELILRCLDPGISSEELFERAHSAILMSGTLTPTRMYRDLLKMEKKRTKILELPNPFPIDNKLSLIVPETTTKYSKRREEEFKKIGEICAKISNEIPGNVGIFFPSYEILNNVSKYFDPLSKKAIFIEKKGMSKRERISILEKFKSYSNIGAVFLWVTGGSFSEGVDLPGKFLNGAIIVGIPLEKPDLETQALIEYYDKLYNSGWNYGYIYPAMNKAIQAAGRVIRSETDKGVIVFLDERFIWRNYFKCLPLDWKFRITKDPIEFIKDFFKC